MNPLDTALSKIIAKDGLGVYASANDRYKGAIFGRDSLEVAEDLMTIKPQLVKDILTSIAMLQGTENNDIRDEKSGKIHHEYRTKVVDEEPLDAVSRLIFDELAEKWGGNTENMIYYGSVDATPLYVKTLCQYCDIYGQKILNETFINKEGNKTNFYNSLNQAIEYLTSELERSDTGLLYYQTNNPNGLENQAWKDSKEFYVHKNGESVNHDKPIISIEVQGITYDALIMARKYLPLKAKILEKFANKLQKHTIDLLWLPKDKYFALGIDFDNSFNLRLITTRTANPASLLNSMIFDNLNQSDKERYIKGIITTIFSDDFLTDAGIRSRALSHAGVVKFWDYHGSYTTWPKETYDISKGLRKFGFNKLAQQLENRVHNAVLWSDGYPEYFYVDKFGRILKYAEDCNDESSITFVNSTNTPEQIQAWTISSIIAIQRTKNVKNQALTWEKEFEQKILSKIKIIDKISNKAELRKLYPDYLYKLKNKSSLQFNIRV